MRQRPEEIVLGLAAILAGTIGLIVLLMDAGIWIAQHTG